MYFPRCFVCTNYIEVSAISTKDRMKTIFQVSEASKTTRPFPDIEKNPLP